MQVEENWEESVGGRRKWHRGVPGSSRTSWRGKVGQVTLQYNFLEENNQYYSELYLKE